MKRYDISNGDADNFPYVAVMRERADGDYCALADLHAWALKHKATVEGMECNKSCASRRPGYMVGGISFDVNEPPKAREVKHAGDCPRCVALREIEELLK